MDWEGLTRFGLTSEGVTLMGPAIRALLAGPTKVGACLVKGNETALACVIGTTSSGVNAKDITSIEMTAILIFLISNV